MKNSNHIQYFPSNVLTKIFSFISEEDMCNNVPFVCEKWKIASSYSMMMKTASFEGKSVSSKDICFVLHNAPLLESITIISCDDVVPVLRQISRCNKRVTTLVLKNCSSNGNIIPEEVLINIVCSLADLHTIELYRTRFKSDLFFEIVSRQSSVTGIDLSLNEFISLNNLMKLVHNNKLEEFKLSRRFKEPEISDEDMSHLIRMMRQQLVLLHLDMSCMGNNTYQEILSCSKLVDLKLNNAMNLSREILEELPSRLRKLKHLSIEGPTRGLIKGDLLSSLFTDTNFGQQLESLKLENFDSFSDEECCNIIECCPNLKDLSLKGCKSLSIDNINKALPKVNKLNYLNIAFLGKPTDFGTPVHLPELKVLVMDEMSSSEMSLCLNKELKVIKLTKK